MTARRLVVWRHGQTAYNAERRVQGHVDVPLNAVGVQQAKVSAEWLATLRPAALVASDLSRAVSTAAALAERTGLTVSYDPDLREIACGEWEGMLRDDVDAGWPEVVARDESEGDVPRGRTGESILEVANRAEKGLRRAAEQVDDGQTVIVATHGLAGAVGVGQLVGFAFRQRIFRALRNCHWVTVQNGPRGWQIVEWNVGAWPTRVDASAAPADVG